MSKVYLIGAGPGDEELITVKAVRKLKECTAVLYDRLVGNNVLNYLNDNCEIYYCGKEPGCHYKTQEEINETLVKLAKKGHVVGRIKGGDPYVFGRGGEEALELIKEDIEFEVIPGVTSAISVLNYGGIPITQRAVSQSFHVVTGMSASSLKVNWEALSKENGTLVFLMGLENLEGIVSRLIENGKSKETPSAVVMRGTSSKQKKVVGTLEDIYVKSKEAGLKSPCIIVVGDVVELNDKLDWYGKKPLFGANICITRSKGQSSNLREKLKDLGAEVTEINSIEFKDCTENLDKYLDNLQEYNHIILTSVNGVNHFFDYIINKKYDIRKIKASFSVVGKATAKALTDRGIIPDFEAKEFLGEGLFEVLRPNLNKGEKVLIPCSLQARDYISEEISKLGIEVHKVATYETIKGHIKNPKAFEEVDLVVYTSPTTVKNMIDMIGAEAIREKKGIAIGPITFEELKKNQIDGFVCKEHSEDGLIEEVKDLWRGKNA